MFKIVRKGAQGAGARVESDAILTPTDFQRIAETLGNPPIRARKIGYVAARKTTKGEAVRTRWNGNELSLKARRGDFIVTNLSPRRVPLRHRDGHLDVDVIMAEKFANLYEPTGEMSAHGAIYRAKGTALALPLAGGFDILASWGERQSGAVGYLVLNDAQVYGACTEEFEAIFVKGDTQQVLTKESIDIFISYKREDREKVRQIVEALESRGWSVWWDARIGAGEAWDLAIERALEASKCVVVIWSQLSTQSLLVRSEAQEGFERGCLVPVTIDRAAKLPITLKLIQAIDLSHWRGDLDDFAFKSVCAAIERFAGPAKRRAVLSRVAHG